MNKPAIACFGLGPIGVAIAERLLAAGYDVHIWNRTAERAVPLMEQGAQLSASIEENIRAAEIILSSLPNAPAIQEVLLEVHWAHELEDRTVIQLGHLNPQRSCAIMDACQAHGAQYIEAPLMGSVSEAAAGQLLALVGATQPQYQKVKPLLSEFVRQAHHIGEVGQASAMRLAFTSLTTLLMCAFSGSLGLLQSHKVSAEQFMDLLRGSSCYASLFDQKLERLLKRDYALPELSVKNLLQELNLLTEAFEEDSINAPFIEGVQDVLYLTVAKGLTNSDFSAMHDVVFPPRAD
jgi:3-hydroxyisobutyrate dehydrogenase